jgi:haloacetate dehalogenase
MSSLQVQPGLGHSSRIGGRKAPKARRLIVLAAQIRADHREALGQHGDSAKPVSDETHAAYSKRAMAQDQLELMQRLGFERFAVVGHDRGARVARRLALDHAPSVTRLAVPDIVPTAAICPSG